MRECIIQERYGLRLGQRVVFVEERDPENGVLHGQLGTICCLDELYHKGCVGIEWDAANERYHNCMNTCDRKHGWWVPNEMVAPYDPDIGEIQRSDTAIESLIGLF